MEQLKRCGSQKESHLEICHSGQDVSQHLETWPDLCKSLAHERSGGECSHTWRRKLIGQENLGPISASLVFSLRAKKIECVMPSRLEL